MEVTTASLIELAVAGVLIGLLLGALGAGGAIFTAPVLMLAFDVPAHEATTVSLVVVLLAAMSGLLGRRGTDVVKWREGATFGAVGAIAAVAGSLLADVVSATALTVAFSVLLVVAAVAMWRQPESLLDKQGRASYLVVVCAALGVGLVTGFFGVGGGFVIVPALVLFVGFGVVEATATGLLVIAINVVVALVVALVAGGPENLDWAVALPMALGAVLGSFAGARIAPRLPQKRLRQTFAVVMVAAATWLGLGVALAG